LKPIEDYLKQLKDNNPGLSPLNTGPKIIKLARLLDKALDDGLISKADWLDFNIELKEMYRLRLEEFDKMTTREKINDIFI